MNMNPDNLYDQYEETLGVASVILHPNYNATTMDYDFAMVMLSSELSYNECVQPVCLPFDAITTTTTTSTTTTLTTTSTTSSGSCKNTCFGQSCDYWYTVSEDYTCHALEGYACDCSGCGCGACPSTCFGYTCEYWQEVNQQYTCDYLQTEFGCNCGGCDCNPGDYVNVESSMTTTTETSYQPLPADDEECALADQQVAIDCVPWDGHRWDGYGLVEGGLCVSGSPCNVSVAMFEQKCNLPFVPKGNKCSQCNVALRTLMTYGDAACVTAAGIALDQVCVPACKTLYEDLLFACVNDVPDDEDPVLFSDLIGNVTAQLDTCFELQCTLVPSSWAIRRGATACRTT